MKSEDIERVTKRHIGRLLERLEEIGIPSIVKDSIKGELWLMADDVKQLAGIKKDQSHEQNEKYELDGNR